MAAKLLTLLTAAAIAWSQTPPKPSFEVASVRRNHTGQMTGFSEDISPGGRFTARNLTVWNLIRFAYHLRDSQMTGGPAWLKTQGFDIEAQPAAGGGAVPQAQVREMMQGLLAERFKLAAHRETRPMPAYELKVAAGGPRLQPSSPDKPRGQTRSMLGDLIVEKMRMTSLANILEFDLERPVIDRTGLAGEYDFKLEWARESARSVPDQAGKPSIFTALQEQLGLRLESARSPVEVMVIENATQPSEN